jgi:hypothetical protein
MTDLIPMKQWRFEMAERFHVSPATISVWMFRGKVKPKGIRMHGKMLLVSSPMLEPKVLRK